jgi:hypothetical protein
MHKQIYLSVEHLNVLNLPQIAAGDILLGIVYTHGFTRDGKEKFFGFPRVKKQDGTISVIENYDPSIAACPYPPPCTDDFKAFTDGNDCYKNG